MSILEQRHSLSWIIVGPESSGSKFVAKTIASTYAITNWNGSFATESNGVLIYHRSCPFERPKKWSSDIISEIELIEKNSRQLNVIFTTRDPDISASRKSIRFGECTIEEYEYDLAEARKLYAYLKDRMGRIFIWSYEAMTLLGESYIHSCHQFFGLGKAMELPEIQNRNRDFIFNSALFEDRFSETCLTYNVNLYRANNEPVIDHIQSKTLSSLRKAINASPNRLLRIVISTGPKDYEYMRKLCAGSNRFFVRLLGEDSREQLKPYLRDILQHDDYYHRTPGNHGIKNAFCLYANADICVPQYFFELVFQQISVSRYSNEDNRGANAIAPDCYVFNRRDITDNGIDWHPGSDLFIFPVEWLSKMKFGNVCIGLPPVAPTIWLNCLYHSRRTIQVSELYITSHHGNDQNWKHERYAEDRRKNYDEAAKAFRDLINYNIDNLGRIDLTRHSILPKDSLQALVNEWTATM